MLQNKPLLLGLVALLVLIKFVVLPLQEKQQALYQQLDSLTKRVDRSEALLAQKEQLQQAHLAQQQQVAQLLQPFAIAQSAAQYQVTLQQQLQQLAAANQVSVTFFDWLTNTPLEVFGLQRGRVSWRVEGEASRIMQLHLQLEQQFPQLVLRDLRANWRGELNRNSRIELNLLIEVDYLLQEPV